VITQLQLINIIIIIIIIIISPPKFSPSNFPPHNINIPLRSHSLPTPCYNTSVLPQNSNFSLLFSFPRSHSDCSWLHCWTSLAHPKSHLKFPLPHQHVSIPYISIDSRINSDIFYRIFPHHICCSYLVVLEL
jgi:hypothetical protein